MKKQIFKFTYLIFVEYKILDIYRLSRYAIPAYHFTQKYAAEFKL